ncbi:MAG: hypothetical protein ACK4RK_14200 [Gemmataceae bacterium]
MSRRLWGAFALCWLVSGCFGVSQNPGYFPHLLPTGDIIRTHAKPPFGVYKNFDPYACRLEVRPLESTNPVQTQHVLIATVYDAEGNPLRKRRVEWMLEGVGNIVEVDEAGLFPGRGYKVDNKYAVSYTAYKEQRITRGNDDPTDDIVIRPGQTWCVITSAVEGDTKITVYAPEIHNWDQHKVFVTKHWVDAEWELPPPAINPAGTEHVFTTRIYRHTNHEPLANYRVRYRIIGGPPAVFVPGGTQEAIVLSDMGGNASVTLAQVQPALGLNRVSVEIIRPPDPCAPSGGLGVVVGGGVTTKEWLAPQVLLDKVAPPSVLLGEEIPYTITVRNTGKVETQAVTILDTIPDGLLYLRSEPTAQMEEDQLVWTLPGLSPGQAQTVQAVFRTTRPGPVQNRARAVTPEGPGDEKSVTTLVTVPQLQVVKTGPPLAVLGMPVPYQITVSNPGDGPAHNVVLTDQFDDGLEHDSGANPIRLEIGTLAPGANKTVTLSLTPRVMGRLVNRVVAVADGNLRAESEHAIEVQRAQLRISKTGPAMRYIGRPAIWEIQVQNPGDVPLTNVVVRDQLPPELVFTSAGQGGTFTDGQVVWNLGTLQPEETKIVEVTTRCERMTPRALNVAVASADPGLQVQAEAAIEILGLPAFRLEVDDVDDPVAVGGRTSYQITVTNQGSLAGNGVRIVAQIPPQMRAINANGPTRATISGATVTFPPVDGLEPGQALTYIVEVECLTEGDVRFRAELSATSLLAPVVEEESTTIYNPATGPRPTSTEPPPAGNPSGTGAVGSSGSPTRIDPIRIGAPTPSATIGAPAPTRTDPRGVVPVDFRASPLSPVPGNPAGSAPGVSLATPR